MTLCVIIRLILYNHYIITTFSKIAKFNTSKIHKIPKPQKNLPANNCHIKVKIMTGKTRRESTQSVRISALDIIERDSPSPPLVSILTEVSQYYLFLRNDPSHSSLPLAIPGTCQGFCLLGCLFLLSFVRRSYRGGSQR